MQERGGGGGGDSGGGVVGRGGICTVYRVAKLTQFIVEYETCLIWWLDA